MQKYNRTLALKILQIYKTKGIEACIKQLPKMKLTRHKVRYILHRYNLISPAKKQMFNVDNLIHINSAEAAYILGFIWADGHVEYPYRITIRARKDDLTELKDIFKLTNDRWTFRDSKKGKKRWHDQLCVRLSSKIFSTFLYHNGYKSKSENSADAILNNVPIYLHVYWFRGLVDGDGHFQCGKKTKKSSGKTAFICGSTYKQDWVYFERLLKYLNIKYKITRRKRLRNNGKIHSSSSIEFYKKNDILKFGNYIYQNYLQDNIGLKRKYNKFQEIVKRFQ